MRNTVLSKFIFVVFLLVSCSETVTDHHGQTFSHHDVFLENCSSDTFVFLTVYLDGSVLFTGETIVFPGDVKWVGLFPDGALVAIDIETDIGMTIVSDVAQVSHGLSFHVGECDG